MRPKHVVNSRQNALNRHKPFLLMTTARMCFPKTCQAEKIFSVLKILKANQNHVIFHFKKFSDFSLVENRTCIHVQLICCMPHQSGAGNYTRMTPNTLTGWDLSVRSLSDRPMNFWRLYQSTTLFAG